MIEGYKNFKLEEQILLKKREESSNIELNQK